MIFNKNESLNSKNHVKKYKVELFTSSPYWLNHSGGDAEGESFRIEMQVRAKSQGERGGSYSEFQLMGLIE